MIRQIDFRPPVYPRAFVHDQVAASLAHRRRAIWFAVPGNSLSISRGCDFSTVPGLTRWYYRMNPCKGNLAACLAISLICSVAFAALDEVEHIEEMDQPTFHLRAPKGDLSLNEAAMNEKPCESRVLIAAKLRSLG